MKRQILIAFFTMVLMTVLWTTTVSAEARVTTQVTVLTDHSAKIELIWADGSGSNGLMITNWRFRDEGGLVVYYKTGQDLPQGYATRTVSNDRVIFPMVVLLEKAGGQPREFTDISSDSPGLDPILNLYYRGIIGGYPDGTFKPGNNVTRAEFSKMLLLTAGYAEDEAGTSVFADVADSFWGKKYIMPLASRGILKGKGEGTFDPNGQIKIGEVLAVLTRTFELYQTNSPYPYTLKNHWSNDAFLKAAANGIVTSEDSFFRNYDPEVPATRLQCSVALSRVLESLHDVTE